MQSYMSSRTTQATDAEKSAPTNSVTTGGGVGASVQAALATSKEYFTSAQTAAQPYIDSAVSAAQPQLEKAKSAISSAVTTGTGGMAGGDIPESSVSPESVSQVIPADPYPTTTTE